MIKEARSEAQRLLNSPANKQLLDEITAIKVPQSLQIKYKDSIDILWDQKESPDIQDEITSLAKKLMPWRKGPFRLNQCFIDSEWQSFIKFNTLKPFLNLKNKIVADVGCNNGYYMFKMLESSPSKIVGFDPCIRPFLQFKFIEHFIKSGIEFELAGVEHLPFYEHKFDTIFCLGVLYHRQDPIGMLKQLKASLNPKGEVILDTLYIDGQEQLCLSPNQSYAKMKNVYFIPTINALKGWCERAKFKEFELLQTSKTSPKEQRKTQWIQGQSLEDFLNPDDENLTIEGYEAPKRAYVRVKI